MPDEKDIWQDRDDPVEFDNDIDKASEMNQDGELFVKE